MGSGSCCIAYFRLRQRTQSLKNLQTHSWVSSTEVVTAEPARRRGATPGLCSSPAYRLNPLRELIHWHRLSDVFQVHLKRAMQREVVLHRLRCGMAKMDFALVPEAAKP